MSTGLWTAGKLCPITYTPTGGSLATLQVTEHGWQEIVDTIDITHTGSGGIQALLAGILRGSATVKAFLDTTSASTKYYGTTVLIRCGGTGMLAHYVGSATANQIATLFFAIPIMIESVQSSVPTASGSSYEFTAKLNSEAGAYSYPS